MKRLLTTVITALISTTAFASQESSHYLTYFQPAPIQQLITHTELYNDENGYWEQNQIMNQELVRYLNQIDRLQGATITTQH